ncbi:MAG: 23S rRNA (pseudouridine(1915)-N(3))-methyltransferase RlmH [Microvirgula sp.]
MKITLLAVGTKMPRWVDDAYADYAKRLPREVTLELREIKPEKRGSGVTAEKGIAAEHARIMAALPPRAKLVLLDERGKAWTTMQLADGLKGWLGDGQDIAIVVGGADGTSDELKARADLLLQLSAMTLPHGMVRVLLAEQIYRAVSILNGHPYHRE